MNNPDEQALIQKLLTPLRESIINKPPYTSGTLRLSDSCFSLFYRAAKDGKDARFEAQGMLRRLEELG
jgi:hypothetical protein